VGGMILYKAAYNLQSMADFFKALESHGGGAPSQWFSRGLTLPTSLASDYM